MPITEKLPFKIETNVEKEPLFSAMTDVDENGNFCEQWVVMTDEWILVFLSNGEVRHQVNMEEVKGARTIYSIGGGSLVIDTENGPIVLIRFTVSLTGKFSIAAKAIESLSRGEELPVLSKKDLPQYCPTCNRPLQEGTNVCPRCVDKKKVVLRLLRYAKPYRKQMFFASILMLIGTLMELAPPYLTKIIVDDVLQPQNFGQSLLLLVLALGLTQVLLSFMQTFRGYIGVWVGSKIMRDIRTNTYHSLLDLSLSFFDRRQTSQFIGRVNSDVESVRQFLTDGVMWISGQVMMLLAIIVMMLSLDWKLALLAMLPAPIILIFSKVIWPYVRHRWYKQWRAINQLNMIVGDSLQGIRVVKAFGQEHQEKGRYDEGNKELMTQTIRTDGMWQGIFPLFSFLTGSGALLVWYFGGKGVLNEEMTLGTLMALIAYLGMFFGPLQWFSQAINWMSNALSAADRIFEILDTRPDVPNPNDPSPLKGIKGKVVLNQVTFGYEHHDPVLKNINLEVKSGEMIGLVGHSGAGKSTLINLISRFYDPDHGEISIDGINLCDIRQEDLHQQIGVVLQETFLFDGSISENICYSKPDASPEEIMRAAKIANAHDFIVHMTDGYDYSSRRTWSPFVGRTKAANRNCPCDFT
jgi:ATP-binding cassette subfamily B protein